jgi:hypothetical protein
MTDEPLIQKKHCFNCRAEKEVVIRRVGDAELHRCVTCGLWIRCPKCMHIQSVEGHKCVTGEIPV